MTVTWNPDDKHANISLSNGNLTCTADAAGWKSVRATEGKLAGKWYWEVTIDASGVNRYNIVGAGTTSAALANYVGSDAHGYSYFGNNGNKINNGAQVAYGNTFTTNDVIGIALDMDNGKIWFSKNGVWQNSGDPAAGTNEAYSGLSGTFYAMMSPYTLNNAGTINFGVTSFNYTPPTGFSAMDVEAIVFSFSNPVPTNSGTIYVAAPILQLTTTISGAEASYVYDAAFYNANGDVQIGSTVSGVNSGSAASSTIGMPTPSGASTYSWYMTATSSGQNDTSPTYYFDRRFLCVGTVEVDGTATSGIPVRLYRRDTGALVGEDVSTGISGTFEIETTISGYFYAVALYATTVSGEDPTLTNALIYDWLIP